MRNRICKSESSVLGKYKFVVDISEVENSALSDALAAAEFMEKATGVSFRIEPTYLQLKSSLDDTTIDISYGVTYGEGVKVAGHFRIDTEAVVKGDVVAVKSCDKASVDSMLRTRMLARSCLAFRKILDSLASSGMIRYDDTSCQFQYTSSDEMYMESFYTSGFRIIPTRYGGDPVLVAFSAFPPSQGVLFSAPGVVGGGALDAMVGALGLWAGKRTATWTLEDDSSQKSETYEIPIHRMRIRLSSYVWASIIASITLSEILGLNEASVSGLSRGRLDDLIFFCMSVIEDLVSNSLY